MTRLTILNTNEKRKSVYIPEVLFDPDLLLSLQLFLLGVLFSHEAFLATNLTGPEALSKLDIYRGEDEMILPLKPELFDKYVFRKAVKGLTGYEISDEPIPYGTMARWVKRVGELLGLEVPTIPYNLRYNAANAFDNNSTIVFPGCLDLR